VKDIVPGSIGSGPETLGKIGRTVFFGADDRIHGREL
jgi:hypothetical protein